MNFTGIKEELIKACLEQNPKGFIPFLMSHQVKTDMPNKIRFYSFFKHMINYAKQDSIGEWNLKLKKTSRTKKSETLTYNFFDETHKYARLTIIVTESSDNIILETMPF